MFKKIFILLLFLSFSFNVLANDFLSVSFWQSVTLKEVKEKITNGIDINAKNKDGMTALMYAAANNERPEIIATLITHGADIYIRNKHRFTSFDYIQENE